MKNSHSHIKSVTGTVGSCKKPFQYVPITYDVCIVSMATALTSEYCSRTISPVDMTADWTFLTGVKRQRCSETNTVNLTSPFQPSQPVPISPGADRTTNIFIWSLSEFRFIIQISEFLNNNNIYVFKVIQELFNSFIYSLLQCFTGCFLFIRTMFTSFDTFYEFFDIESKLVFNRGTSKDINLGINSYSLFSRFFRTCINFKAELNIFLSDYIGVQSFSLRVPFMKMFMKLYRKVKNDFLTNGLKMKPGIKFNSLRVLEFSYGT